MGWETAIAGVIWFGIGASLLFGVMRVKVPETFATAFCTWCAVVSVAIAVSPYWVPGL